MKGKCIILQDNKFEPVVLPETEDKITPRDARGFARYLSSIEKFEREKIIKGCVLFYGSSGFTRWTGDKDYPHPCAESYLKDDIRAKDGSEIAVNHGFGSSTMHELCYYYERAVRPWKPKAIVVTSYINDYGYGYTNDEIMIFVNWLTKQAKKDFPDIKMYFTDVRPRNKSLSDAQINNYLDLQKKLLDFAEKNENVDIILTSQWEFFYNNKKDAGTYKNINPAMFIEDGTHYTVEGYKHFAEGFRKALDEVL